MRWAQRQAVAAVPGAYLTTTIDLYDANSPCGAVHIRNKTAVGTRLALGTLATMTESDNSTSGLVPLDRFVWPTLKFANNALPLSLRDVDGMTMVGTTHCNFEITTTARPANVTKPWAGWKPYAHKQFAVAGDV